MLQNGGNRMLIRILQRAIWMVLATPDQRHNLNLICGLVVVLDYTHLVC